MPRDSGFVRTFEGKALLDELLEVSGAEIVTEDVISVFTEASRAGEQASEIIPSLFDGEPRFPDPALARRTYQNLLGLWDLVAKGGKIELEPIERPPRPKPEKKPAPVPPKPFGKEGPDEAFVESGWRWLADLDKRERDKLLHAFENRQDALLAYLDEQAMSDEAYACARFLLFELFSMIEAGHPPGLRQVSDALLAGRERPREEPPAALRAYADEAVFEAGQDEEAPLAPADAERVREVVGRALSALWNARK